VATFFKKKKKTRWPGWWSWCGRAGRVVVAAWRTREADSPVLSVRWALISYTLVVPLIT